MATADELAQWIVDNKEKKGTPEFETVSQAFLESTKQAEPPSGWKQGLKDPIVGGARLAEEIYPEWMLKGLRTTGRNLQRAVGMEPTPEPTMSVADRSRMQENTYEAQRAAAGEEGIDWDRIGGNVVNPINLLIGAKLPAATSLLGRVGSGALGGSIFGALQPSYAETPEAFWQDKARQTVLGGATGAAIPPILTGLKAGGQALGATVMLKTKAGALREAVSNIKSLAGPERQQLISAIDDLHQYLPDSPNTTAEAIAQKNIANKSERFGAPIVKLQAELARAPETTSQLNSITAAQRVARENALNKIAKTPEAYEKAVAFRKKVTDPLWAAVEKSTAKVDTKPVDVLLRTTLQKNSNTDAITKPLYDIHRKLNPGGRPETDIQKLISLSADVKNKLAAKNPDGTAQYDVKVLTQIKESLDDVIGKAEPAYKSWRTAYRTLSRPMNRMDVGNVLKDRLLNPSGNESPGAFLGALDDAPKTLKKATGFSRYKTLDDVLLPDEVKLATNVAKDMERNLVRKQLAQEVNVPNATTPGTTGEFRLPNLLWRPALVANFFLRHLGMDASPDINKAAAQILANPAAFKKAIAEVPKNKVQEVVADMTRKAHLAATLGAVSIEEDAQR